MKRRGFECHTVRYLALYILCLDEWFIGKTAMRNNENILKKMKKLLKLIK